MGKLKETLGWFVKQFDRINEGLALVAGAIVGVSSIIIIYEVFMRYGAKKPTTWVNEISEMFLIYITFLGSTWVLKQDGHTKVDILIALMSERRQEIMGAIQDIFSLLFCGIFTWLTWANFWDSVITQERTPGGLFSIPYWIIYIVIPFGCFLMCIQLVIRIIEHFSGLLRKGFIGSKAEVEGN
jgi:C4-dicarboxylate transporter DctQ subunit